MTRIKIVPDNEPNSDGLIVEIDPAPAQIGASWADHEKAFAQWVPKGWHLVAVNV